MIFRRFLDRFLDRFGRGQLEPKLDQKRTKIEDEKEDAKRNSSRSSCGGLGAVLERCWAILAELEAILGRFGAGGEAKNVDFPLVFQ